MKDGTQTTQESMHKTDPSLKTRGPITQNNADKTIFSSILSFAWDCMWCVVERQHFFYSGHLRLSDFGLSRRLKRGGRAFTVCGTIQYMGEIWMWVPCEYDAFNDTCVIGGSIGAPPALCSTGAHLIQLWILCSCDAFHHFYCFVVLEKLFIFSSSVTLLSPVLSE